MKYICTLEAINCEYKAGDGSCTIDKMGCGFRKRATKDTDTRPIKWFEEYMRK